MRFLIIFSMFILPFCFSYFAIAQESDNQDIKQNVKDFYISYATSLNEDNLDESIRLIDAYVSDDFGHYNDGALIYGKAQFLSGLKDKKDNSIHTDIRIDIKDINDTEVKDEIRLNFDIFESQEIAGKLYQTGYACHDSLRKKEQSFELYKCDCKKIEYKPE